VLLLEPPASDGNPRAPSGHWAYLHAFDFALLGHGKRELRFVGAREQAECIPMRGGDIYEGSTQSRASTQLRA
jgi:hypothetical protein